MQWAPSSLLAQFDASTLHSASYALLMLCRRVKCARQSAKRACV